MSDFSDDMKRATADLEAARAGLLDILQGLRDEDLELSRRGGWPIRDVLLHVIGGERHYTNGINFIRGRGEQAWQHAEGDIASTEDAVSLLEAGRNALLTSIDGMDEDSFYTLKPLLNEEGHGQTYSVLSILENIALHDREHAGQIEAILVARGT